MINTPYDQIKISPTYTSNYELRITSNLLLMCRLDGK